MTEDSNWRMKTLIIGALLGTCTGLGAAYLLVQRADREGSEPKVGTGEGIRLGLLVLGLLRQVGELTSGEE
jgi:hypothetical protein